MSESEICRHTAEMVSAKVSANGGLVPCVPGLQVAARLKRTGCGLVCHHDGRCCVTACLRVSGPATPTTSNRLARFCLTTLTLTLLPTTLPTCSLSLFCRSLSLANAHFLS